MIGIFGAAVGLGAIRRGSALAPASIAAPAVSGTGKIGSVAKGAAGTWLDADSLSYHWEVLSGSWQPIPGATGIDHLIGPAQDGLRIRLAETAIGAQGSATAYSNALSVTHAAPEVAAPVADRAGSPADAPDVIRLGDVFAVAGDPDLAGLLEVALTADGSFDGGVAGPGSYRDDSVPTGIMLDAAARSLTLDWSAIGGQGPIPITLRATNSGGSAQVSFRVEMRVTAAPAAFGSADWSVAYPTPGLVDTVLAVAVDGLPEDGGAALTQIEYRVNGGEWQVLTTAPAAGTFSASGTNAPGERLEIRAVNAVGAGTESAAKSPAAAEGPNLVLGGDFASQAGWVPNANVSVAGGVATFAATTNLSQASAVSVASGEVYRARYVVRTGGGNTRCNLNGGGSPTGTFRSTPGSYQDTLSVTATGSAVFRMTGSAPVAIDEVSLRKVL